MAVVSLLLGPRPPALSALWQTGGRRGLGAARRAGRGDDERAASLARRLPDAAG